MNKNLSKQVVSTVTTQKRVNVDNTKLKARAILLDLDGTVVDSREAYHEAAKTAFAAMGLETFKITLVTEIPKRLEQDIPIDDLMKGINLNRFLQIYLKAYYQATVIKSKPFPNVADTLRELSGKAKLALTTRRNVSKEEVIRELAKFGLAEYFQNVITSRDTQHPKPSPDALVESSRQLKVGISECLVVGDSVIDVRAGRNAGAKTVGVLSGIFSREELEREEPDLILENISKLPAFLK